MNYLSKLHQNLDSFLSSVISLICLCRLLWDSWGSQTYWQIRYENYTDIYWLISMFSRLYLHTSAHLAFCYVLKRVVWMGLLLIAAGICFGFILLANQEMLYCQANQKRWHLRVVERLRYPWLTLFSTLQLPLIRQF